jgi:hypothetical protein
MRRSGHFRGSTHSTMTTGAQEAHSAQANTLDHHQVSAHTNTKSAQTSQSFTVSLQT